MGNQITFNDLSDEIENWQALPLSLNGFEVVPLDYNAGKTGWIIYGKQLNKTILAAFQKQLSMSIVIVSSWKVKHYQVVRFAGTLPKKAQKVAIALNLDVASINTIPNLALPGLLVMDLDSTAIHIESIYEMAKQHGVLEKVELIMNQALNGEIDLIKGFKKSVLTLKGAKLDQFNHLKDNLPITKGFHYLVTEFHKRDWKIVILTGGFSFLADCLKEQFQLYAVYANELGIDKQGRLTGRLKGEIIDAKYKMKTLQTIATELNIPLEQTVAIGDGLSDLMMIKMAGLGVAYHSMPKVAKKAPTQVQNADLTALFCILSASLNTQS